MKLPKPEATLKPALRRRLPSNLGNENAVVLNSALYRSPRFLLQTFRATLQKPFTCLISENLLADTMNDAATTFHPSPPDDLRSNRCMSGDTERSMQIIQSLNREETGNKQVDNGIKRYCTSTITLTCTVLDILGCGSIFPPSPSVSSRPVPQHRFCRLHFAKSTHPKQWLTRTSVLPIQAHPRENRDSFARRAITRTQVTLATINTLCYSDVIQDTA